MKKISILLSLSLCAGSLMAQNLNPEVQVTNDYVTKMMDVDKQRLSMSVPDSMLKFDYHFDYSVFESPYKGAYEFTPYSVDMSLEHQPRVYDRLYMRAGAGYSLHPELEVVWAPVQTDRFDLTVFEELGGYAGKYLGVDDKTLCSSWADAFSAYDLINRAGVEGSWGLERSRIRFAAGYDGMYNDGLRGNSMYNSVFATFHAGSNSRDRSYFFYDVDAGYRFLSDLTSASNVLVSEFSLNATVGPVFDWAYRVLMDIEACANGYQTGFGLTPKFEFAWGRVDMSAGVRLGYAGRFTVYPDVRAKLDIASGAAQLYASVTGKDVFNGYSDIKRMYHRYTVACGTPVVTRELMDVSAGVRGYSYFGLQYDVKVGGSIVEDAPMLALAYSGPAYRETVRYQSFRMLSSESRLGWKNAHVDAEALVKLRYCGSEPASYAFLPSVFAGNARCAYNWSKRVSAGVNLAWETSRETRIPYIDGSETLSLPGYADLGIFSEYKFVSGWSVWGRGGNLLGMDIRTSPMYAERGPYFTLGVSLSL